VAKPPIKRRYKYFFVNFQEKNNFFMPLWLLIGKSYPNSLTNLGYANKQNNFSPVNNSIRGCWLRFGK